MERTTSIVGLLGIEVNFIIPPVNSLAWDISGNRLIAAAGFVDSIYQIDTLSGAATEIIKTGIAYPDGDIEILGDRILESTDTHQIVSIGAGGDVVPLMSHKLFGVFGMALLADGRLIGVDGIENTRIWQLDTTAQTVTAMADITATRIKMALGAAAGPALTSLGGSGQITGDDGHNDITGSAQADEIRAGGGIDVILTGAGADLAYGNADIDLIQGEDGADTLFCGQSRDKIDGGADGGVIYGNLAADWLIGGAGDDLLYGGRGGDEIYGDPGADTLIGNLGDDQLSGGDGADLFLFRGAFGHDVLRDFTPGTDHIALALEGGATALEALLAAAVQNGSSLRLALSDTASLNFATPAIGDVTAADFWLI